MSVEVAKLILEHGGVVSLIVLSPPIALSIAVVVLWRQNNKMQEKVMELVRQKIETDVRLMTALDNLSEVIKAQNGR